MPRACPSSLLPCLCPYLVIFCFPVRYIRVWFATLLTMVNNLVRRVTHVFDVAGSSRRPSTWNPKDNVKADLLEVSDRRIRYKGAGAGGGTDSDAAAVRSDQVRTSI